MRERNSMGQQTAAALWHPLLWATRLLLVFTLATSFAFAEDAAAPAIPVTGAANPDLASFDRLMLSFMSEHKVPGGSLAVARNGKLVYARGFGYADAARKEPVQPQALFRIASVSKPLTAVAVMRLAQENKLKLGDKVFALLLPDAKPAEMADPRLAEITILQLLQHTGGWDREKSFDPMFRSRQIAKDAGVPPPAGAEHILRYMLKQKLDFAPGERYAYSNFGYCLLGRAIEKVTGKRYDEYVRETILTPLCIRSMRIGKSLAEDRAPGEVEYFDAKGRKGTALFGTHAGESVPSPYGTFNMEPMDSHGAWIASVVDLVQFAMAFHDPDRCKILSAQSISRMFERPAGAAGLAKDGKPKATFYACGWSVRPVGKAGKANTWHTGLLPGTSTLLVRRHDGLDWAVLFNTDSSPKGETLAALIDPLLHKAADAVEKWPESIMNTTGEECKKEKE